MQIQLPKKVQFIIDTLIQHGHEAYAVGGCVRDIILGRNPEDWDITTSASPYEVKNIFHRTVDTGIQHGTVTVLLEKEGFEVTTYRIDGEYTDNRRPNSVQFTKSLTEDLKRRDFTINAMAYNDKEGLVDKFSGIHDMENQMIRCVGVATERFDEDALRILRAIRFSAQLNFHIEEETLKAIVSRKDLLNNISAERIREELNKLLLSKHPEKLLLAYDTGVSQIVLPEFKDREDYLRPLRGFKILMDEEGNITSHKEKRITRYVLLLHSVIENYKAEDMGKLNDKNQWKVAGIDKDSLAKDVLRRLKFDNETIHGVDHLLKHYEDEVELTPYGVRKAIYRIGLDFMELWLLLRKVAIQVAIEEKDEANACHKQEEASKETYKKTDKETCTFQSTSLEDYQRLYEIYQSITERKECVNLKMLKVNGKDLIGLGIKPGVNIGIILNELLEHVLANPEDNNKEHLLSMVKEKV